MLILDNCRIHHAEEIHELVEDEAGIFTVWFILCFDSQFTQVVSSSFCHLTHPITIQLNKLFYQSSVFSGVIGRILVLVLWTVHARTSLLTRQMVTLDPLGTQFESKNLNYQLLQYMSVNRLGSKLRQIYRYE